MKKIILLSAFIILSCLLFGATYDGKLIAKDKVITINLKNADLVDVVRMIARDTKINLLASDDITGQVTLSFRDVPVDDVLEAILSPKAYTYIQEGGIVKVMKISDAQNRYSVQKKSTGIKESLVTEVMKIKYLKAEDVKNLFVKVYPGFSGSTDFDPITNSIILQGYREEVSNAIKIMNVFDVPPLQVAIKVHVVEVTNSNENNFGVDWSIGDKSGDREIKYDASNTGKITSGGQVTYKIFPAQYNLSVVLKNLITKNHGKILSDPNITAVSGHEAYIHIGKQLPFKEVNRSETGEETIMYTFKDIGIKLSVTPTIQEDGNIDMVVKPEVSGSSESTADNIPIISTREANTRVIVKAGNTLAIGGLMKTRDVTTTNNVPLLSDIPILGEAFKSKKIEKEQENLIIFITPTIVKTREYMKVVNLKQLLMHKKI